MTTAGQPYSSYDDALIRMHWETKSSHEIAAMLVPPRNPGSVRGRAKKLGLVEKKCGHRNVGGQNGNFKHGKYRQKAKPKPAIEPSFIPILARDFCRWRKEVHGL